MIKKNPAPLGESGNGAQMLSFDTTDCASFHQKTQYLVPQAVSRLVRRFGFALPTARTVCRLAGLGGGHAS